MMYKQGQVGYIPGYKIEYPNEDKPFLPYLYLRYTKVTIAIIHHKIAKSIKERWGNRTSFFVGIFKDHSCLVSILYIIYSEYIHSKNMLRPLTRRITKE